MSRLLTSMLFGETALDPLTCAAVISPTIGGALLAAWAPAPQAVGVQAHQCRPALRSSLTAGPPGAT